MKKAFYLFLAVTFAGFSTISCGSDDDKGGSSSSLVGKWEYFQAGMVIDGEEFLSDWEHSEGCDKDYMELLSNGTGKDVIYWEDCEVEVETFDYAVSGNTFTIDYGDEDSISGTYSISSGILKIKEVYEGTTYMITYKKK